METINLTQKEMEERLYNSTLQIFCAYVASGHSTSAFLHQSIRDARNLISLYEEKNNIQRALKEQTIDLFASPS